MKALVLVVALTGCLRNAAYPCSAESDCVRSGEQGVCEPTTGFCSFSDSSCPDGRRYGDLSGKFAGQCVADGTPIDGPPGNDGPTDGPPADMAIDMMQVAPFCDAAGEPDLVGCWEFEGNFTDASGDNNNGTANSGTVTFVAGKVGMAMRQTATARVAVADSASLEPTSLTIEAWIMPTATSAARMGILDNQNSYGFFITPNLAGLQCIGASVTMAIPLNVFTHVACTYASGGQNRIYVNGVEVANVAAGGNLTAGAPDGSVIGGDSPGAADSLIGLIDQMRVWKVARTAAQICAATGQVTCP